MYQVVGYAFEPYFWVGFCRTKLLGCPKSMNHMTLDFFIYSPHRLMVLQHDLTWKAISQLSKHNLPILSKSLHLHRG